MKPPTNRIRALAARILEHCALDPRRHLCVCRAAVAMGLKNAESKQAQRLAYRALAAARTDRTLDYGEAAALLHAAHYGEAAAMLYTGWTP